MSKRSISWKRWRDNHWAAALLHKCRSNSRRNKGRLEFTITVNSIIQLWEEQKGLDVYTGIKMKLSSRILDPCAPSVDRIDSNKGYIIGNVCLCCAWINKAKGNMSREEFLMLFGEAASSFRSRYNDL